jgi:hypothetical protein
VEEAVFLFVFVVRGSSAWKWQLHDRRLTGSLHQPVSLASRSMILEVEGEWQLLVTLGRVTEGRSQTGMKSVSEWSGRKRFVFHGFVHAKSVVQ